MKHLLIVSHIPSNNTIKLRDSVIAGTQHPEISSIKTRFKTPFQADIKDILWAHALLLGTTENLGYMSGALKDFFDRTYNLALNKTDGLPYGLYIRAGTDGTGTKRSVKTITTGLRWREVQPPLILKGPWQDQFLSESKKFGTTIAAGLESGVF